MNNDPTDDEIRGLFRLYNAAVETVGKEMMADYLGKSANSFRNEMNIEAFLADQGRAKAGLADFLRAMNRVVDPLPVVTELIRLMGFAAPLTVAQADAQGTLEEMAIELLRVTVRFYEKYLEAKDPKSECGSDIGPGEGKTLANILDGLEALVKKARGSVDAETVAAPRRRLRVVK